MTTEPVAVIGGVGTRQHTRYAAAINEHGRLLDHHEFPANDSGYIELLTWMRSHGPITVIGVESTGSFGTTLTRGLTNAGQSLVTAGDNTGRIHNETAFAELCCVAPQPASSRRTSRRHRLSRSGDRHCQQIRQPIISPLTPTNPPSSRVYGLVAFKGPWHRRAGSQGSHADTAGAAR